MPVLVVAGALDDRFRPLAGATVEAIGRNARLAVVAGAGHAVFFERPGAFVELVREFLDPDAHAAVNRAGSKRDPDGQQGTERELKHPRRPSAGDEVATLGPAQHPADRRQAATTAEQGEQGQRPPYSATTTTITKAPSTQAV